MSTEPTLDDRVYAAVERAIAENYHGTPVNPSAIATLTTLATRAALDEVADGQARSDLGGYTVVDVPGVGETRAQGHPDARGRQAHSEIIRAAQRKASAELKAAGLREFAGYLDAHPLPIPVRSSVYAQLAREKAEALEAGEAL
ncbi:hypothetical protein [Sphaerisporangium aureirubrum]|uniref:Uncharacterized protein n=1 Tax=Sphaerisporangium aureirubrum TaxID=1544736 RepID=A0ABW1NCD6_9ACTN